MLDLVIKNVGGIIPKWQNLSDAGLDLHASEDMIIRSYSKGIIPLGIQTEFPPQYVAIIKDRSSLAAKGFYTHAGVIDSSYRGEWKVVVENTSGVDWEVKRGDRIAQVVFLMCLHPSIVITDSLSGSVRGVGGFGSTG